MSKSRVSHVHDAVVARAVLAEQNRRQTVSGTRLFSRERRPISRAVRQLIERRCHAKQREMLLNTARFKLVCCPRRTGKTTYNIFETIVHDDMFPGSMIAYIVPDSKAHAKDLFWEPAKKMNEALHLGWIFKEVEKRIITPNGTHIILLGSGDKDSVGRLRGSAWSLVLFDEAKDFGSHFSELVMEAVLPGLGDYGGSMIMSGTPGDIFDGIFYEISTTTPEGWCVAKWIKSDNTFLRAEERDLQKVWETAYKPLNIAMDSPKFRREQKAEWVREDSERAYLYHPVRNYYCGELNPLIEYEYICGIDIGKGDKLVLQPAAFSYADENLYYLEPIARRGMFLEQMCEQWEILHKKYNFIGTVVDTGGLGVMIVDDLNMRKGYNWQAAKKGVGYKLGAVEQMNNDFLMGKIKAHPDSLIAQAWSRSIKNKDNGLPMHSDECDAALYVHRYSFHWQGAYATPTPEKSTDAWWLEQEKEEIEKAIALRKQRNFGRMQAISDQN